MEQDERIPIDQPIPSLDTPWDDGTSAYTGRRVEEFLKDRLSDIGGRVTDIENGMDNLGAGAVDESLDPLSANPVRNSVIAAKFAQIEESIDEALSDIPSRLRLNKMGEGESMRYSMSLLNDNNEVISTSETWTGAGGALPNEIILQKVTENLTVKVGNETKLTFYYDHQNKSTHQSTDFPAHITITIEGAGVNTMTMTAYANDSYTIDVTKYIKAGTNSVTVKAQVDAEGDVQSTSIRWTIQGVNMELNSSYDLATAVRSGSSVNVPFTLVGANNAIASMYVDGVVVNTIPVNSNDFNGTFQVSTTGMSHGSHSVQIVAELSLSDTKKIRSNSIYFDIAVVEDGVNSPVVATRFDYPGGDIIEQGERPYITARQYENYTLTYAVYNPSALISPVTVYEDNVQVSSGSLRFEVSTLRLRANTPGSVGGRIECGGTHNLYLFGIEVAASDINLVEPIPEYRTLYLNAIGRSNNDTDKEVWGDTGLVTFSNVLFGSDGWTGTTLRLMDNGKATVNFSPLRRPAQNANEATAFIIKYRSSNVEDDNAEIIKCLDTNNRGFLITPTEISVNLEGASLSMKTAPNETYEVAIVTHPAAGTSSTTSEKTNSRMVYLYINGIMSGASRMVGTSSVYQTGEPVIEIGSPSATTEIFLMRAYGRYLSDSDVLGCYILDQENVDTLIAKYNANNFMSGSTIDLENIPDGMRVVIITGVQSNNMATAMQAAVTNDKSAKFNLNKDNGEGVLTYIKGRSDRSLNFNLKGGCIRLQGTSSLAYPIKNYRIYVKDSNKVKGDLYIGCDKNGIGGEKADSGKYSFRDAQSAVSGKAAAPVDCWCLKADYAESSSSHNTGMARIVQDTLISANELTPPQKYVSSSYAYDVRTTIDGEPCLLFYRKTLDEAPVFLGKYNWNNDKSTEAVFGFCDIPGYHTQIPSALGNPTECWEFLTNDEPMGEFLDTDFDRMDEKVEPLSGYSGSYGKVDEEHTVSGGIAYDRLGNRIGIGIGDETEVIPDEDYDGPYGKVDDYYTKITNIQNGKTIARDRNGNDIGPVTLVAHWTKVFEARFPDDDDTNALYKAGELKPRLLKEIVQWVNSTREDPQKFRDELANYFDVDYLCDYYEFTEIFGCVDQRVKNMMMAIWYNPDAEDIEPMGKMRAYMIFYDNDTIMGVRNDGRLKYSWDIDENTIDPEFTSSQRTVYAYAGHNSVLWKNLRSQFQNELKEAYIRIRNKLSNVDIFNMFDNEQSAKFPERIYNLDAVSKYIKPLTMGVEVIEDNQLKTKTYTFLESMQGSRYSHRHWWITNRLSLFDAWAATGSYTHNEIAYKGGAEIGSTIKATPVRDFYFYFTSDSANTHVKVNQGEEWSYTLQVEPNVGTIFKLRGVEFIGELNLAYWGGLSDLTIPDMPKLESLTLGLASTDKVYPLSSLALENNGVSKVPLLKRLVIQNHTALRGLDIQHAGKIEYLDCSGCPALANVTISKNAPLTTYITPEGMSSLTLEYLPYLENEGLTISNLTRLGGLTVNNCPGIRTDELVAQWLAVAENPQSLTLEGVDWTLAGTSLLNQITSFTNMERYITGHIRIAAGITVAELEALQEKWGNDPFSANPQNGLKIDVTGGMIILAAVGCAQASEGINPEMFAVLKANAATIGWADSGKDYMTDLEAAQITNIGTIFKGNTQITSLEQLEYFTGLTSFSRDAFANCSSVKRIKVPANITSITQDGVFSMQEWGIEYIEFPSGLTNISNGWTFANLRSADRFIFNSEIPPTPPSTIKSMVISVTYIYVPAGTKEAYVSAGFTVFCSENNIIEMI